MVLAALVISLALFQVTKLSLSCRVVDEQQVDRHYANSKLSELYKFSPDVPKANEEDEDVLAFPAADMVLAELLSTSRKHVSILHLSNWVRVRIPWHLCRVLIICSKCCLLPELSGFGLFSMIIYLPFLLFDRSQNSFLILAGMYEQAWLTFKA
jgi:hypothetical protein